MCDCYIIYICMLYIFICIDKLTSRSINIPQVHSLGALAKHNNDKKSE